MQHHDLETVLMIGRILGIVLALSVIPAFVLLAMTVRGKPARRVVLIAVPLWLACAPVAGQSVSRWMHAHHSSAIELMHLNSTMASAPLAFLYVANTAIVAVLLWLAVAVTRRGPWTRRMAKRLSIIGTMVLAGCAHSYEASVAKQRAECAARNGELISFPDLYPGQELSDADKRRFFCNIPTEDAGKACTTRIGQCQGLCLAPPGASYGQAATGTCSSRMLVPQGTRLIVNGVVAEPVLE
jgi:hypothetical protein